jgi:hypothetical protein
MNDIIENNTPTTVDTVEASNSVLSASTETTTTATETVATTTAEWYEKLDADLKGSSFIDKFKDKPLTEILKSAIHAEKLIGKKVSDFTKDDLNAFMMKQGMPASKDEYKLVGDLDKDVTFKEAFHAAKLTQDQAQALSEYVTAHQSKAAEAAAKEMEYKVAEAREVLSKEFGDALDKRLTLVKNTILELGGNELLSEINNSGLGASPAFIKMMANIGKEFGEAGMIHSDAVQKFGLTPHDRKNALNDIFGDADQMEAWKNPMHPNHKLVKEKIHSLMKS